MISVCVQQQWADSKGSCGLSRGDTCSVTNLSPLPTWEFLFYIQMEREKEESREARELVYKYTDKFTARNAASISLSLSRSIRKREEAENYLLRAHGLPRNVSLALRSPLCSIQKWQKCSSLACLSSPAQWTSAYNVPSTTNMHSWSMTQLIFLLGKRTSTM